MDCIGHNARVEFLHALKHLQCLVPVLVLGTHVQQAGECCCLRMEVGAANDVADLPCNHHFMGSLTMRKMASPGDQGCSPKLWPEVYLLLHG